MAGTETDSRSVVLDLHQKLDGLEESELGGRKIGTTGKGIGPCYSTKASRSGIRLADVFQQDVFEDRVRTLAYVFSHLNVAFWPKLKLHASKNALLMSRDTSYLNCAAPDYLV